VGKVIIFPELMKLYDLNAYDDIDMLYSLFMQKKVVLVSVIVY